MPFLIKNHPYFDWVDELFEGRDSSPIDMDGHRTYLRNFLVKVKTQYVDAGRVAHCPGLPIPNSPYIPQDTVYGSDLLALARKFDARMKDPTDWQYWVVTVTYTTRMPEGGPSGQETQDHPELEYPDVSFDFETVQYAPQHDLLGKPFVNSADVPFSPPFTMEVAYAILNISRNELDFSRERASAYAFAINDDKFLGADRGTVMCMPPKAQQWWRGRKMYWKVTYRLRFAPAQLTIDGTNPLKSFDPVQVLDAGSHEFVKTTVDDHYDQIFIDREGGTFPVTDPATGLQARKYVVDKYFDEIDKFDRKRLKPIIKFGSIVSKPVLLDGQGHEAIDRDYTINDNDEIVWLNLNPKFRKFNVYRFRSFRSLLTLGLGGYLTL